VNDIDVDRAAGAGGVHHLHKQLVWDVAIAAEGHHAMLRFCDAWPEQRFELAGFNVLRVEK